MSIRQAIGDHLLRALGRFKGKATRILNISPYLVEYGEDEMMEHAARLAEFTRDAEMLCKRYGNSEFEQAFAKVTAHLCFISTGKTHLVTKPTYEKPPITVSTGPTPAGGV